MTRRIAIVGAGYSGTLLALHLLERPGDCQVALVERSATFARGLAYSTHNPRHLLNVRVGNMSAWADDPDHLKRWLAEEAPDEAGPFISRGLYGRYLAAQLQHAASRVDGPQRLILEQDEVVDITPSPGGRLRVALAMGRAWEADAVVLATGHQPPASPPGPDLSGLPRELYAPDPWAADALEGLGRDEPVLLLGSGLTMVDAALALDARGHRGEVTVLSRRGLVPRRHEGEMAAGSGLPAPPPEPLSRRLAEVRRRAARAGWRTAMDGLRPFTASLWRDASEAERRRFLRHLRPWWEAHRHRMSPQVADWLDGEIASRRIHVHAGRLTGARPVAGFVEVRWRPRASHDERRRVVGRVVNCTGARLDLDNLAHPLLRSLKVAGLLRADPLGLGLDVSAEGRVIGAAGAAAHPIYAVGPLTRGALWEITAVPDIRAQVAELARVLAEQMAAEPELA